MENKMATRAYFYLTKIVKEEDGVTSSCTIRSTIGKDPIEVEKSENFGFWVNKLPPGCSGKVKQPQMKFIDYDWNDISLTSMDEEILERYINSF